MDPNYPINVLLEDVPKDLVAEGERPVFAFGDHELEKVE
jgi:hypothetical protein